MRDYPKGNSGGAQLFLKGMFLMIIFFMSSIRFVIKKVRSTPPNFITKKEELNFSFNCYFFLPLALPLALVTFLVAFLLFAFLANILLLLEMSSLLP
jgi:hypothetical protein